MLSLCCDYRLMTDFGKIGMNEVGLGIPVPPYWGELLGRTIGHGRAKSLLLTGEMICPQKAFEFDLVNEVCSRDELLPRSESYMKKILKMPINGRIGTKKMMFSQFSKEWISSLDAEAEWAFGFLSKPENVKFLSKVIALLTKQKSQL